MRGLSLISSNGMTAFGISRSFELLMDNNGTLILSINW